MIMTDVIVDVSKTESRKSKQEWKIVTKRVFFVVFLLQFCPLHLSHPSAPNFFHLLTSSSLQATDCRLTNSKSTLFKFILAKNKTKSELKDNWEDLKYASKGGERKREKKGKKKKVSLSDITAFTCSLGLNAIKSRHEVGWKDRKPSPIKPLSSLSLNHSWGQAHSFTSNKSHLLIGC